MTQLQGRRGLSLKVTLFVHKNGNVCGISEFLRLLTDGFKCSDGQSGSAAAEPVKEARTSQDNSGKQQHVAMQGSTAACAKADKARASTSTANPSKSSKIQKRSQRGSRMQKQRPAGPPPNRHFQFRPGLNPMVRNVHGHRSDFVSVQPPFYRPVPPQVRSMMPVGPGELPF